MSKANNNSETIFLRKDENLGFLLSVPVSGSIETPIPSYLMIGYIFTLASVATFASNSPLLLIFIYTIATLLAITLFHIHTREPRELKKQFLRFGDTGKVAPAVVSRKEIIHDTSESPFILSFTFHTQNQKAPYQIMAKVTQRQFDYCELYQSVAIRYLPSEPNTCILERDYNLFKNRLRDIF